MKEAIFYRQNYERWQHAEAIVEGDWIASPDELADAYIGATSDLAFAQTHYPGSRLTLYLNNLCFALHTAIYRNKREPLSRLVRFWTHEVPLAMHAARREFAISAAVFLVSILIGVVSTLGDAEFPRIILGNDYVDMTLENIERGQPMAVYARGGEVESFLGITVNNVIVSFRVFAAGLLTFFGTGYLLLTNGIMMGAFMTLFFQHGLLWPSFLAVFLHGTLELSAIVVAGAAGLALGSGWLFPGTYARRTSFMRGARRGLKIVVGTVPIFLLAGFIEGFVTRHTELPDAVRLLCIICSAAFVAFYYVLLPKRRARHAHLHRSE